MAVGVVICNRISNQLECDTAARKIYKLFFAPINAIGHAIATNWVPFLSSMIVFACAHCTINEFIRNVNESLHTLSLQAN